MRGKREVIFLPIELTRVTMNQTFLTLCFLAATISPENTNADQPSSLAVKYLKRTNVQEKYACAIFCEATVNDREEPDRSCYVETWYLHSFDPEQRAHRQDELTQTMMNGAGTLSTRVPPLKIVYYLGEKVLQWNGENSKKSYDLKSDEGEKQFEALVPHSYFEPLTPTIIGHRCFDRRTGPRLSSHIGDLFSIYRWIEEEEFDHGIAQVFSTRNADLFNKIYFDKRYGNMPALLQRTIGKNGKHFERIATKWIEMNERWYPSVVEIEKESMNTTTSRKLWYYWMFDGFPADLFPNGKADIIHSVKLRELIAKKSGGPVR